MANPAPTINQINAFNATQGTTIDFNIIGGTELVRSNRIYIYDLSDNSLICTHLYVSTESIHELPPNTDGSIVYESGKSSVDFVNGAQYYAQIQTFTDIAGTEGGSGLSVAKMFWCLVDPTLTITTIPSTISTTSYNVSATYNANTSVVSNIIQQYQFSLYSATGSLLQSSGVVVGNGEQQGTSTAYDISYNFTGLSVGSSYYVAVDVTTTQGMSVSAQSGTFTVSIDTPTLGEATVVNNACDGYISVTSNLSSEYGGSGSGEIVSFETDSENVFTKLKVAIEPTQSGSGTASPDNVRPIYGVGKVVVNKSGKNLFGGQYNTRFNVFIPANTAFTASAKHTSGSARIDYFDVDGNRIDWFGLTAGSERDTRTITSAEDVYSVLFTGTETTEYQIELGTTATAYEPYQGQTVSQEFDVSLTPTSKDTDPYLFKAVGDIYGDRLEEDIVGGTVCWNQLRSSYHINGTDSSGITFVNNGDSSISITGTVTAAYSYNQLIFANMTQPLIRDGRKYLILFNKPVPLGGGMSGYSECFSANSYGGIWSRNDGGTWNGSIFFRAPVGTVLNVTDLTADIIDLTSYFGSTTIADYVYSLEQATAGSGIAWLKSHGFFTKPYYEYDTGTLKSVNPTAHVTRGVNAWDEEWVVYDSVNRQIRSKTLIPLLPNTQYYIKAPSALNLYFRLSDETSGGSWGGFNSVVTTPNNCVGAWLYTAAGYGTTYNNDICINISDPTINGQYFPYEEHTYDLGNVTLRGIPKLVNGKLTYDGDIRKYDGTVTRNYLEVTYDGSENWFSVGAGFDANTNRAMKGAVIPSQTGYSWDLIGSYVISTGEAYSTPPLWRANFNPNGALIIGIPSSITTVAEWKAYLAEHPLTLIYKVTPTTEQTDPFTQIQNVSKYGTLEYITTNDVPVGHNTTYLTRDIFGGTDDLVSGQLLVDRVSVLLNGQTDGLRFTEVSQATTADGTKYVAYIPMNSFGMKLDNMALCDSYDFKDTPLNNLHVGEFDARGSYMRFVIVDQTLDTLAKWNEYLANNPMQLVYELATPLTYQLTPKQIQTLVGVNNVWSEQGNVELSYHIPITNLLVKRQDVDDVSGNWLTLYSQPVEQASDMDFTFIDFLNQYGKTYKYALVPLLTQTQSGVEVEVEGGYTVSDEVQSIFDGVFISDSTGSQKCKANVGYGNVNMNQSVGSITPIGSQYPIIVTNSNNRYHNGSISGMIVPDDYYYNGNLSRIDMVNKRNELEQFLTNKRAKIIKDWNSNIWLVMIMDNIDCSFDNNYGMGIVTFNANWLEVGDPTNQEDLQATGLVDVGGV